MSSVLLQLLRRSSSPCLLRALWRSARRPGRQERQSRSAPRAATCGTPIVGRPTRRQTTVSADERAANTVRWQVFGLVGPTGRMAPVTYWPSLPGSLLTRAVGSSAVPPHHRVRLGRRSFPLTAAGQSQILTGFPLASPVHRHRQPGEPAAGDTICDPLLQCQHHILGRRVGVSVCRRGWRGSPAVGSVPWFAAPAVLTRVAVSQINAGTGNGPRRSPTSARAVRGAGAQSINPCSSWTAALASSPAAGWLSRSPRPSRRRGCGRRPANRSAPRTPVHRVQSRARRGGGHVL